MADVDVSAAINLRLALLDLPLAGSDTQPASAQLASAQLLGPILARQREFGRQLAAHRAPVDGRIQSFLDDYLSDVDAKPRLPGRMFELDQPGLARALSLPSDADEFTSDLISSYRVANGVLHNPRNDRRTTAGVFHVAEGGLLINDDKLAVPKVAWGRLVQAALQPPEHAMTLPYGSGGEAPPRCFVSLLLRPLVVPEVPGYTSAKRMEIRFIAPGSMVANLDFVEGIFGNGGDADLPANDAALDPLGWTGHTGCVILAPHLTGLTKKSLGLPHRDDATERQRRDGMCWTNEDELYNDGQAFKAVARDERGVIVTVIADNYFGYCKKEVKTQIGYSANLYGASEEEHAGGALVYPAYDLGRNWTNRFDARGPGLADVLRRDPQRFERREEGHAVDTANPRLVLVPAGASFDIDAGTVSWDSPEGRRSLPLRADHVYFAPDGYRVQMEQDEQDETEWTLIGISPQVTQCHKPSTVSGGGKSEISKAISDAIVYGTAYVPDIEADLDSVTTIFETDFSNRFADPARNGVDHRPILSNERSVGSVIKLLTRSSDFNDEYNAWLETIPTHIFELVIVIKRAYRPGWGEGWRSHFSVGIINGRYANALRLEGERVRVGMLRVGFDADGAWRLFSLRPDFHPAAKVQTEDDITASTVAPGEDFGRGERSAKFVANCERLLFQRPDDAIHRGYDTQAEADIAGPEVFLSNFEPMTRADARAMRDDAVAFSRFTAPMRELISTFADTRDGEGPDWFVSSAHPRLIDGARSKNPRYLQIRPDMARPSETAAADLASHLHAGKPLHERLPLPVDVVAAGRRNNPAGDGVPPLCAFSPLHYLELPELFMEFISSMTGKSPSTTGAGSEGALTKAPFNAMPTVFDLNAALLSYVLTGYDGWISSAGYIGPNMRIDHDISLLVPELFSRMQPAERDARSLIEGGHLEKVPDVEYQGHRVLGSRLGYRMTRRFATTYFARIFMHPERVFTNEMLRPERQDMESFARTIDTMTTTHERVAQMYFVDGSIELACPPLRALLEVMAHGRTTQGWTLESPELRELFTAENVTASEWYQRRVESRRDEAVRQAEAGVNALDTFMSAPENVSSVEELGLVARRREAQRRLDYVTSDAFRDNLVGALGRQDRFR